MKTSNFRRQLLSTLANKMEGYLPQFGPCSSDYQMVGYACRDFEEWIRNKWNIESKRDLYKQLEETMNNNPLALKNLLNLWASLWLEKWNQRVKVLFDKPKLPSQIQERIKDAKLFYRGLQHKNELKEMINQKLIRGGELCMTTFIAENLIIEEIAKANKDVKYKKRSNKIIPFTYTTLFLAES
jgi:hypothetical protein